MPRFYQREQFGRERFGPKECFFCKEKREVDYKDANTLSRYLNIFGAIDTKYKTGLCAKHQRQIAQAIKRAREIGLLSPISR